MNRIKITTRTKKIALGLSIFVLLIGIPVACVYWQDDHLSIESMTVAAGDEFTIILKPRFQAPGDCNGTRMVISVLAPKMWNLKRNAVLTYEVTNDEPGVIYPMYLIPDAIPPKQDPWKGMTWGEAMKSRFGIGQNIPGSDMEWVTFWSDPYDVTGNKFNKSVDVFIKIKTSYDNVKCKLGFFLNHSDDGISTNPEHWKITLMDEPFETTGAPGDLIDFTAYQPNMALPMFVSKDDIVTIRYMSAVEIEDTHGNMVNTALYGAEEVFLCASAYTFNGKQYDQIETNAKTRMMRESEYSFQTTFWPADYFNIPENEDISRIEYYFVNADKSLYVQKIKAGVEAPFRYVFECR